MGDVDLRNTTFPCADNRLEGCVSMWVAWKKPWISKDLSPADQSLAKAKVEASVEPALGLGLVPRAVESPQQAPTDPRDKSGLGAWFGLRNLMIGAGLAVAAVGLSACSSMTHPPLDEPGAPITSPSSPSSQAHHVRTSLAQDFADPTSQTRLIVSHDWDLANPYNSMASFERSLRLGADAVKTDVRPTKDGLVLVHSSPFKVYESLDCVGDRVETMTTAEATDCHILPSLTQKVQTLDTVLNWAKGKTILELDVKDPAAFPATIQSILRHGAEDRVFLFAKRGEFYNRIQKIPGWERLHYLMEINDPAEILAEAKNRVPQVMMLELDPSYPTAKAAEVSRLIREVMHPAGLKALAKSPTTGATAAKHEALFKAGFDAVKSYDLRAGVPVAEALSPGR